MEQLRPGSRAASRNLPNSRERARFYKKENHLVSAGQGLGSTGGCAGMGFLHSCWPKESWSSGFLLGREQEQHPQARGRGGAANCAMPNCSWAWEGQEFWTQPLGFYCHHQGKSGRRNPWTWMREREQDGKTPVTSSFLLLEALKKKQQQSN